MDSELKRILASYERRKPPKGGSLYPHFSDFQYFAKAEREYWYGRFVVGHFGSDLSRLTLLEVGAGSGPNLYNFMELGIRRESIFANELIPERAVLLNRVLPAANIITGDARLIEIPPVDIVFQSTMFSSILDPSFQRELAAKLWTLVKPGGMVLWHDFTVNNPRNPDVSGVAKKKIKELFPEAAKTQFKSVTLAPPIGRRVGRLYNFLNFPFLRSHVVAALFKELRSGA